MILFWYHKTIHFFVVIIYFIINEFNHTKATTNIDNDVGSFIRFLRCCAFFLNFFCFVLSISTLSLLNLFVVVVIVMSWSQVKYNKPIMIWGFIFWYSSSGSMSYCWNSTIFFLIIHLRNLWILKSRPNIQPACDNPEQLCTFLKISSFFFYFACLIKTFISFTKMFT